MSKSEKKTYINFLESCVVEDADAIDIPTVYNSLATPVRDWDGNSQLPAVSKEENLDEVINKILKKSPDEEGTDDPEREEGGPTGSIQEVGNLADDAKKKVEGNSEQDEADADGEECAECDKKLEEICQELGISPLALLEDDESDDDDDDDDDDDEDDEKTEKDEEKEPFSTNESRILESLIKEMKLAEEGEDDEFSDEDDEDDETNEDDNVELDEE